MHEITDTDGMVFTGKRAWHGLGTVVEEAPTPSEAIKMAGLDWEVEKTPCYTKIENPDKPGEMMTLPVPEREAIRRVDTCDVYNVVSTNFTPIQNSALAEFAEALAGQDDTVKLESAGSIRGGRKVFLLIRSQSFAVNSDKDEVKPYILLANGHDGSMSLRGLPTTIRVVCSNTLHASLSRGERAGFAFHHTTRIRDRVAEAKQALGLYHEAVKYERIRAETLASKDVKAEDVQAFWLECYQRAFDPIPTNPTSKPEEAKRFRATQAMAAMSERFDRERDTAGANMWNAANAFTGWYQHDRNSKSDDVRRDSNLFGDASRTTVDVFERAVAV